MIIKGKLIGITNIVTKENKVYDIANFEYEDKKTTGKNVVTAFIGDIPIKKEDIGKEFTIFKKGYDTEIII